MKKNILSKIFLILVIVFTLTSCKKENITPPDTSLTIWVSDGLGNNVSGAKVDLYTSLTSNDSVAQITDSKGLVTFKGLSPITYYYSVVSGCMSNLGSSISTINPIVQNTNTQVETILKGTGVISYINNSSNPYDIYLNGVLVYEINGKSEENDLTTEGAYTIRVLQVSGYLVYPTDETFTGNVVCGGDLTVTFP